MANGVPAWFVGSAYMDNKLKQMQTIDPDYGWDSTKLADVFRENGFVGETGYYDHFTQFGNTLDENISPNANFVASEYYQFKAIQYFQTEAGGSLDPDVIKDNIQYYADQIKEMINKAGMTAWDHYQDFGSKEGVNPSNAFDESNYLDAKAQALNDAGVEPPAGKDAWDADAVKEAIEANNMSVLEHYMTFADGSDGEVDASTYDAAVPDSEKVNSDSSSEGETYTLKVGEDNITGTDNDDTFEAQTAGNPAANTLEAVDILNGGGGDDTLNASIVANTTPVLRSIENVNVRSIGNFELDLSNATGVKNVTVHDSTGTATVKGFGAIDKFAVTDQGSGATITGNTATTMNLTLSNAGNSTNAAAITMDNVPTTLNVSTTDSYFSTVTAAKVATLNVTASGTNVITADASAGAVKTLSVTGSGSFDASAVGYVKAETVEASSLGGSLKVKVDDTAVTVNTGEGNDTVKYTAAVAATAKVSLGLGDDTLLLDAGLNAGATLDGGDGDADVIGFDYTSYAALTAADVKNVSNFEILGITSAIGNGNDLNVSTITGITGVKLMTKEANGEEATISGLSGTGTIEYAADLSGNHGTVAFTDAALTTLNLTLNHTGDLAAADVAVATVLTADAGMTGLKTLNITATATDTTPATDFTKAVTYTIAAPDTATALTTVNIDGDQKVVFATDAAQTGLTTISASGNSGGVTIDASASTKALTITDSGKADTIISGEKGDTITLTGGNDTLDYTTASGAASKIGEGNFDTINGFTANTVLLTKGDATSGAVALANRDGDVLKVTSGDNTITFSNVDSAADALTFLQNNNGGAGAVVAFDKNNGNLYIDSDSDGEAEMYIHLNGVDELTSAAFDVQ